jgi:hypothetical protein
MLKRPAIPAAHEEEERFQGIAEAHGPRDTAVEKPGSVFLREFHHSLKVKHDRLLQEAGGLLEGPSLHGKIEIDADCLPGSFAAAGVAVENTLHLFVLLAPFVAPRNVDHADCAVTVATFPAIAGISADGKDYAIFSLVTPIWDGPPEIVDARAAPAALAGPRWLSQHDHNTVGVLRRLTGGDRLRAGDVLGEGRLQEVVKVTVQDAGRIALLDAGAQVLDHLIGLEDVGADLVAPADVALAADRCGQRLPFWSSRPGTRADHEFELGMEALVALEG